ncbi:hypothetical protein VP1G_08227 [Cytospora mali]|uniref:Uncharacterized protein n=1 Tax=Cytospora mali TaxID=578113 RepID=A0A194VB56_CYTMA|nr:hypothetical protein VP1G_08227 [Valsa mali var. pyri (nom. inval.)]
MPAINNALIAREAISHIAKRKNWAQKEAGVIVVFAIVFIVAVGVIGLFISRKWRKGRENGDDKGLTSEEVRR